MPLSAMQAVISDMDGVLYRGAQPLPGLHEFFAFVHERALPVVMATNNSSRHPEQFVQKLADMGIHGLDESHFVTSATATASYMQENYPAGTRVFVVGHSGLRRVLQEAGFVLADEDVRVVVVGIDMGFTYEKAQRATRLIRGGADFIGTNPDVTFPTPDGLAPGAGSVVGMIALATETDPPMMGKPAAAMFQAALKQLGSEPQHTLMIGDRLNTDIEGAKKAGLPTALVLTGVTEREQLAHSPIQPDYVFEDLPALLAAWRAEL